jgi:transposase
MFLQDGAPCHRARATTAFLGDQPLGVVKWPGNSPDLNPIENVWDWMKTKLKNEPTPNLSVLMQKIKMLWCLKTPVEYLRNLVKSMPARMEAVIAAGGHNTKY